MDAPLPADPFAVTSLDELARHYDAPRELVLKKVTPKLEARARAFIAASPFALLATGGPTGVHCTPRGDAPGFIVPLDDTTLDRAQLHDLIGRLRPPTRRMKVLVDDLLLLTRLESSPKPSQTDLDTVNVAAMLETIVADDLWPLATYQEMLFIK
jgi:predicted pyridoxine 5'-phosphate oxidase superfamily flavin-nucleotide-binding protein